MPHYVIGGTRGGKAFLAAHLLEMLDSDEYARWRAEARRQAEDAVTAAEGRPADAIPGEVLERGPERPQDGPRRALGR